MLRIKTSNTTKVSKLEAGFSYDANKEIVILIKIMFFDYLIQKTRA